MEHRGQIKKLKWEVPSVPSAPFLCNRTRGDYSNYQYDLEEWQEEIVSELGERSIQDLSLTMISQILSGFHVMNSGPRFILIHRLEQILEKKSLCYKIGYLPGESFEEPSHIQHFRRQSENFHMSLFVLIPKDLLIQYLDLLDLFTLMRTCIFLYRWIRPWLEKIAIAKFGMFGTPLVLSFSLYLDWLNQNKKSLSSVYIKECFGIEKSKDIRHWMDEHGYLDNVRNPEKRLMKANQGRRLDHEYFIRNKSQELVSINEWLNIHGFSAFRLVSHTPRTYRLAHPFFEKSDHWNFAEFFQKHCNKLELDQLLKKFQRKYPHEFKVMHTLINVDLPETWYRKYYWTGAHVYAALLRFFMHNPERYSKAWNLAMFARHLPNLPEGETFLFIFQENPRKFYLTRIPSKKHLAENPLPEIQAFVPHFDLTWCKYLSQHGYRLFSCPAYYCVGTLKQ